MATSKILITGATGDTGGYAIDRLLEQGCEVRALARTKDERSEKLRHRGVEVVYGDFLNFGQVRAALDGVRGAYFCFPTRPGIIQATAYFAQAARAAGVEAIVNMSQISAREDSKSHAAHDHWIAERVFDWSGMAVTHLKPTFFAESLLYYGHLANGTFYSYLGTNKHAPVAAEDQGRVIAGILQNPTPHAGKIYPLFGPKEYTPAEIAQVLGRVLLREIRYKQVSVGDLLQMKMAGASGPSPAPGQVNARTGYGEIEQMQRGELKESFLLQHAGVIAADHQNGLFAGTNDLIQTIGGRPPLSLEAFIEKHRKAFE